MKEQKETQEQSDNRIFKNKGCGSKCYKYCYYKNNKLDYFPIECNLYKHIINLYDLKTYGDYFIAIYTYLCDNKKIKILQEILK